MRSSSSDRRHGRILADDSFEGLPYGVGPACIPNEYQHCQRLQMQSSVFDGRSLLWTLITAGKQSGSNPAGATEANETKVSRSETKRPLAQGQGMVGEESEDGPRCARLTEDIRYCP